MNTNRIEEGDAIHLLDTVDSGSVQTIYFDPPFNSDFHYVMDQEHDHRGFIDKWSDDEYAAFIDHMIDKLKTKLTPQGSLFFHISASEMYIPEVILRSHFTTVTPIFWKKARSKNNVKNKLGTAIDIIFWCSHDKKPLYNMQYQPLDETYLKNSYSIEDEKGKYALSHLYTDNIRKSSYRYTITHNGIEYTPARGWRISRDKIDKLIANDEIHWPKKKGGKVYRKMYKDDVIGKPCMDLWDDIHALTQGTEGRKYPTAKPLKLLERIIAMSSNSGDIVLDPMCGSGVAGVVAKQLERKYIMFDQNSFAVETARKFVGEVSNLLSFD